MENFDANVTSEEQKDDLIEKPENDYVSTFTEVMCEDFNTSKALSILFELANKANKANIKLI